MRVKLMTLGTQLPTGLGKVYMYTCTHLEIFVADGREDNGISGCTRHLVEEVGWSLREKRTGGGGREKWNERERKG